MFKNYLITSLRNIRRNPFYSLITILGFSVGLAAFIIIFLYIKSELSFDKKWASSERIYRITETLNLSGKEDPFALTSLPVGPSIEENVPGIETVVRFMRAGTVTFIDAEENINVEDVFLTDADFYKVFDYDFVKGDRSSALAEPNSIILSEAESSRLFGSDDPMGQVLETDNRKYKVTGVYRTDNFVSHFLPSALISINTLEKSTEEIYNNDWFRLCCYTYILAEESIDTKGLKDGLDKWTVDVIDPWINENDLTASAGFKIEKVRNIHFNTSLQYDVPSNTSRKYIYIFGAIGIFLLLIASINYMNLATAKSTKRAREIGIRKVAGAAKNQLVFQFLSESILYSWLSFVIALIFIEMFTPVFNDLTGKQLSLFHASPCISLSVTWIEVIFIVLLVGLLSGSFPAFILAAFKPINVLKGASASFTSKGNTLGAMQIRKTLVVIQFIISVSMIISTWVVFQQLQFMRFRDLGFNKENIVVVDFPSDSALVAKKDVIKSELLKNSKILQVSTMNSLPGYRHGRLLFYVDEQGEWKNQTMNLFLVDEDYLDLLDMKLTEGRFFSREYANDDTSSFVINQAAVKFLGLDEPIGHKMQCGLNVNGRVIGIVEDFHYASLQKPVEPLVMLYKPDWINKLAIKISNKDIAESLELVEQKWGEFDSKHAFSFSFLDANFDSQYDKERRLLNIFGYFALLIIIISSMGLFGLASFTAEQRTKEIGIRKVLGSSESQIATYMIKEFLILVVISGLFAIPLTYFMLDNWLEEFAYRITLSWQFFAFSMVIAMLIATLTVIFQSLKAARSNPVDTLKYE